MTLERLKWIQSWLLAELDNNACDYDQGEMEEMFKLAEQSVKAQAAKLTLREFNFYQAMQAEIDNAAELLQSALLFIPDQDDEQHSIVLAINKFLES